MENKMKDINCTDIECAVAGLFGYRKNIIVPNISWGAGLHECDVLILNENGFATEVEIKISRADLKKDFSKSHNHSSERIKNFYYAIPEKLLDLALELVPSHAGIITCKKMVPNSRYKWDDENKKTIEIPGTSYWTKASFHRRAKPNHQFRAMTADEKFNIARLGCMRIWPLKNNIVNGRNGIA
jgi:hypothetical protein